jgi:hypothetical protein
VRPTDAEQGIVVEGVSDNEGLSRPCLPAPLLDEIKRRFTRAWPCLRLERTARSCVLALLCWYNGRCRDTCPGLPVVSE